MEIIFQSLKTADEYVKINEAIEKKEDGEEYKNLPFSHYVDALITYVIISCRI